MVKLNFFSSEFNEEFNEKKRKIVGPEVLVKKSFFFEKKTIYNVIKLPFLKLIAFEIISENFNIQLEIREEMYNQVFNATFCHQAEVLYGIILSE